MKEMIFSKDESEFIKECLQNEIDSLKMGFFGQDMETTNRNSKREKECKRLIKKFERAEKTLKTSSRKGKGRGLQYWVCEKIADMFGIKFVQSDDSCLIHSREMGQHGTDIVLRGKVAEKFPFDIECKSCESLSIPEWVRQARANKKESRDWLLVFKKQTIGSEPLVVMEWETFEKIYKGL
jgi:hypothetical protein